MPFLFINNNMAEKTELKINKAVEFLEKINSKQDEQQTRSLSQKMVDSLSSIEKSSEDTNQLLKGVELSASRKQKDTVSIFRSMLSKFFPKDKDMNRTDDNDEADFRSSLLKYLGIITKNTKKDNGFFGPLLAALGGVLKSLFGGSIKDFIGSLFKLGLVLTKGLIPVIGSLAAKLLSKVPKIGNIFKDFRKELRVWQGPRGHWTPERSALRTKRIDYLTKAYAKENSKILGGRNYKRFFKAKKTINSAIKKPFNFIDDALKILAKRSGSFVKIIGGASKSLLKFAGPVGIAITTLEAGITGISKAANAGKLLNKSEELITAGDRFRAAQAGVIESLSFGLISAEKFIEVQDKVSDTMIGGAEKIFGKSIVDFGRTALNFFDIIISDFLELLTGGTFWSDWRSGWDYLKNNFSTAITDMFVGFGESIKNGITTGATWIYNAIGGENNPILKWMRNLVSEVTEGWKNVYNLYIANNPVFKFLSNLGSNIAESITSMYDSFINKLKNSSVGKYLVGAVERAESRTNSDNIARQNRQNSQTTLQDAQSNLKPAQIVRDNKIYKDINEAETSRVASIQSNVSNAFKMNKNTAYNNLSGDDKRLAVLMNFLLEQFAPYMSQLNAEAEKEGGNLQNVALVNPMR